MTTLELNILLVRPMSIKFIFVLVTNLVVDAGAETAADEFVEDLVREEDEEDEEQHQPGHHQQGEGGQVQHWVTIAGF